MKEPITDEEIIKAHNLKGEEKQRVLQGRPSQPLTNIFEKKIIVLGTGGSGKTVFAKDLWKQFKCPLAYDISGDFKKLKGGITYTPDDINGEFITFLETYLKLTQKKKIDAIFFDDADSYIDYELMNVPLFKDLVIRQRNKYKVTLIFIGKRPQNLPTKVVESSHILVIYKIEGHNAIKRLIDIDDKIEPLLEQVYQEQYSYVVKVEGFPPTFNKPIKL